MNDTQRTLIAPKSGKAFFVMKGSKVRIIDVEGAQVADFVCFRADDYRQHLSQANTRVNNGRIRITTGDSLFSNAREKMFTITEDTVGIHDLLYAPCNAYIYEHILGAKGQTGCHENLASALRPFGIESNGVPDPFNIFMNTSVDEQFRLHIHEPVSKRGDFIEMVANMDCLVAITSCAEDISDCNAHRCTPIAIEVDQIGPINPQGSEFI